MCCFPSFFALSCAHLFLFWMSNYESQTGKEKKEKQTRTYKQLNTLIVWNCEHELHILFKTRCSSYFSSLFSCLGLTILRAIFRIFPTTENEPEWKRIKEEKNLKSLAIDTCWCHANGFSMVLSFLFRLLGVSCLLKGAKILRF